jgi:hypothetical protein
MASNTVNNTRMEPPERTDRLEIPWDLSEWMDRKRLLQSLVEDIDTLDWSNPELIEFLRQHPEYQPKMLLQLLTYAYATGTFESERVEVIYNEEETFRSLNWRVPLRVTCIKRFRRENRGLLKWSLVQVLQKAFQKRFELGDRLLPAGLKRLLIENASERLDLARHLDQAELGE